MLGSVGTRGRGGDRRYHALEVNERKGTCIIGSKMSGLLHLSGP